MRRAALHIVFLFCPMILLSTYPFLSIGYGGEETKTLILMGDESFVPYEYIENGAVKGANIDLLREIGKTAGINIKIQLNQWADSQKRVNRGERNGLTMASISEERKKLYDFTQPTFIMKFSVFVKSDNAEHMTLDKLNGKIIAAKKGALPGKIASKRYPEIKQIPVDNVLEGFRLLTRGEVDGVLEVEWVGYHTLKENGFSGIRALSQPLDKRPAYIGILKGNPEVVTRLNRAIETIKSDGRFDKILDKWSGHKIILFKAEDFKQYAIVFGLGILTLISTMTAISIARSRRKDRMRRRKLEAINENFMQEISRRKRAEEEIQQRVEELTAMNNELEEFNYITSHDMKEPIRTIINYCELLKEDIHEELSEDASEDIAFVIDAARRMDALVNDLLELSGVGKRKVKLVNVDLNQCMETVKKDLEDMIKNTNANVHWEKLPVIKGDRYQISSVLQNLVSNGVKFHGEATPDVTVSARKQDGKWEIRVSDNGIGIASKYYNQIFKPFRRLHGKDEYPGTGIGLAVVKKVVDFYSGEISVYSRPGEGSTFMLTIPQSQKVLPEQADKKRNIAA